MTDAFDILGLSPRFDLDLSKAEQRHRELSRALHPDRFAGAPASERRQALSRAIETNEAWRAVRDPILRAQVLLARFGHPWDAEQRGSAPPALLMEVMELREQLAEARRSGDLAAVEQLSKPVRERREQLLTELARAFTALADQRSDSAETIFEKLSALRYYQRFLDEAAVIEDELL